jgi:hypothetical protein
MDVHEFYLHVRRRDIAYIKFIVESYELLGIIRTVDPQKAIIVLLVLEGSVTLAREVLDALGQEVDMKEILRPAGLGNDWLLGEIATLEPNSGNES